MLGAPPLTARDRKIAHRQQVLNGRQDVVVRLSLPSLWRRRALPYSSVCMPVDSSLSSSLSKRNWSWAARPKNQSECQNRPAATRRHAYSWHNSSRMCSMVSTTEQCCRLSRPKRRRTKRSRERATSSGWECGFWGGRVCAWRAWRAADRRLGAQCRAPRRRRRCDTCTRSADRRSPSRSTRTPCAPGNSTRDDDDTWKHECCWLSLALASVASRSKRRLEASPTLSTASSWMSSEYSEHCGGDDVAVACGPVERQRSIDETNERRAAAVCECYRKPVPFSTTNTSKRRTRAQIWVEVFIVRCGQIAEWWKIVCMCVFGVCADSAINQGLLADNAASF